MNDKPNLDNACDGSSLSVWIKWYGPYRSKKAWEKAAKAHQNKDNFTLYLALGRWKTFSLAFTRALYLGLKSKDRNRTVDVRLKKHSSGIEEDGKAVPHKKITGLMNEYWLGEIQTRWYHVKYTPEIEQKKNYNDTKTKGITSDVEKALIFCLNPILNTDEVTSGPNFEFQIINEAVKTSRISQIFQSSFERLVFGLYKYEYRRNYEGKLERLLTYGELRKPKVSKVRMVEKIEKNREGRKSPADYGPLCYRIFVDQREDR